MKREREELADGHNAKKPHSAPVKVERVRDGLLVTASQGRISTGTSMDVKVKRRHMPLAGFNIEGMLKPEFRRAGFHDLLGQGLTVFNGFDADPLALEAYGVECINDLATWEPFILCQSLCIASSTEVEKVETRPTYNVHRGFEARYESCTLKEMLALPVTSLVFFGERAEHDLAQYNIRTIEELGTWRFAVWAVAIYNLSAYEKVRTRGRASTDSRLSSGSQKL